ncbi:ATP-binding cassette domain-containing protein [Microbacterium sp. G2-8]|uniref:ATP-binding cassette domain-containing protein n=1 Tax=Microbacterium sp. G2-8 TaxID=2842454 RepID=UPI001C88F15A|nr:ATP-binding cassette domain-containing protein [Microbacterium sp. G2-8]
MTALLEIQDLVVEFRGKGLMRKPFRALHGVSLDVEKGRTLGLVGESGSGKTTIGRAALGLAPVTSGRIAFDGRDISHLSRRVRREISRDLQVVFQDPYGSLNPAMEIGEILAEPLIAQGASGRDARARIGDLLDRVHLPSDAARRLPHEFSGGQRQRVAIARALALEPKLIVCDEAVSALDLSTQARVLDLLLEIQNDTSVAYLFISHDLDVVKHMSHDIAVLYRGNVVEHGPAAAVGGAPVHPYTQRLLLAAPVIDPDEQRARREAFQALDPADFEVTT